MTVTDTRTLLYCLTRLKPLLIGTEGARLLGTPAESERAPRVEINSLLFWFD
jgi:hypothetical protein